MSLVQSIVFQVFSKFRGKPHNLQKTTNSIVQSLWSEVLMSRKILLILLVFAFLVTGKAFAQQAVRFAEFQIDLWPEYDRAEMLVIYRIQLSQDVKLPVDVTLRIPAAAGEPHAVAVRQMDGSLLNAAYERRVDGQWANITVTATMPEIQMEYYDPQLEIDGADRHFEFSWLGLYPVNAMRILVQQPVGADNLRIEPDLGTVSQGADELFYYIMDVGSPDVGDVVSIKINYQKDGDFLSVESLQVQPSAPIGTGEQGGFDLMRVLPWILGAVGLMLLAGGGFWYWQTGRERSEPTRRKSNRRRGDYSMEPSIQNTPGVDDGVYCHQCGKRAASGDRFCRSCGTKLRNE
jgi:hypothetical protein